VLALVCLAALLWLDEHPGNSDAKVSLAKYAARHWMEHDQFEKVSSRDGMYDLFDSSKPHFAAWVQVHDMETHWSFFSLGARDGIGSPLYYASCCGFYDLAEHLIMRHPEQVNASGGCTLFPLPAALSNRHLRVADLLYRHGAVVDVQDYDMQTPLHASGSEEVDVIWWLLDHGANVSAREESAGFTPLHWAVYDLDLEVGHVLLGHKADTNLRNNSGETPLYEVLNPHRPKLRERGSWAPHHPATTGAWGQPKYKYDQPLNCVTFSLIQWAARDRSTAPQLRSEGR
jgi:hypothetical protein